MPITSWRWLTTSPAGAASPTPSPTAQAWTTLDWTAYNAISFWLYGNETGGVVQVDIFDNRAPDSTGDSAERFAYRLTDDFAGWRYVAIPFDLFTRRTDWQPSGAPDDGLGLDQVSGYAVGFPVGAGAQTAYLDDVKLLTLDDTSQVIIAAVASGEAASAEPEAFVVDDSVTWDFAPVDAGLVGRVRGRGRDADRSRRLDVRDRRPGLGQQRAGVLHPVPGQRLAGRRRQPGDRRAGGKPGQL